MALPTERTEAILHGMQAAFEFFGCVPQEVWWDNPKTVATQILKGRRRKLHERYAAFASHFNFEPLFCMPARGNEKPRVENRVKDLQRRWATPVPAANDFDELNAYLLRCCEDDRNRTASGQSESIGCRFQRDRRAAIALPKHRFDACIHQEAKADKYQTVALDRNRYSVPRQFAFTTRFAGDWNSVTASRPVRGSTSACCNFWPTIRLDGCRACWCNAAAKSRSTPIGSSAACNAYKRTNRRLRSICRTDRPPPLSRCPRPRLITSTNFYPPTSPIL